MWQQPARLPSNAPCGIEKPNGSAVMDEIGRAVVDTDFIPGKQFYVRSDEVLQNRIVVDSGNTNSRHELEDLVSSNTKAFEDITAG